MANPKVGIALGGGAALGFAHLGVLQVLEDENIPIDVIAGCSMGALLGGIYASGCSLAKLTDFAKVFNDRKYMDPNFTFSKGGALRGDKVEELVKTMTEAISFAQCRIPFICNASCIEDAAAVYFDKSSDVPLYRAIRASISLPGIFDPVRMNGKTLVDGGIVDRTALTALVQMEPEVRIACDVSYRGTPLPTPRTTMDILMSSYEILSWHAVEPHLELASVEILPDTSQFTGASFDDISAIIESGVEAARAALPQLKEVLAMVGDLPKTETPEASKNEGAVQA